MELGIIIAIVGSAVGIIAVTITLMLWARIEASADRRENFSESKELRGELISCVRAVSDEMRDFHGRLCALEEKRIFSEKKTPKPS